MRKTPLERFNTKYIVDPETHCWLWTDRLNQDGYGYININKETILAHRFSYENFIGPLLQGFIICHNCNNPSCVNPEHLRQDTHSSNAIDKSLIFKHKNQKLNITDVIEIKIALLNPYIGINNDLSKKYNVEPSRISYIRTGRDWSHLKI
jgi:hypothetical protein